MLETNEATPYYFNVYEGDRFGALLFGAPGAGKSVLANLLIDHSQKDAPYTFILDLGGSYRQITRKHGGSYLRCSSGMIGSPSESTRSFCLRRRTTCSFCSRSFGCY